MQTQNNLAAASVAEGLVKAVQRLAYTPALGSTLDRIRKSAHRSWTFDAVSKDGSRLNGPAPNEETGPRTRHLVGCPVSAPDGSRRLKMPDERDDGPSTGITTPTDASSIRPCLDSACTNSQPAASTASLRMLHSTTRRPPGTRRTARRPPDWLVPAHLLARSRTSPRDQWACPDVSK